MSNVDFYLYRLKLVRPAQTPLFHDELSRDEVFLKVLREKPSIELPNGNFWHIGNLNLIDEFGGYFAVGRTTKLIHEKYDKESGNFTEEQLETSPYTHVVFDAKIGLIAAARKNKLAPTPIGLAKKIVDLFIKSNVISKNEIEVSLDSISDPHTFIDSLKAAYSIKAFEVTFSRSNPFDADEFFQKPMERYLDSANGNRGKTIIMGKDLNSDTLISVTESVAATGNDAKARLQLGKNAPVATRHLRDNPAHFVLEDEIFDASSALREARKAYAVLRGDQ